VQKAAPAPDLLARKVKFSRSSLVMAKGRLSDDEEDEEEFDEGEDVQDAEGGPVSDEEEEDEGLQFSRPLWIQAFCSRLLICCCSWLPILKLARMDAEEGQDEYEKDGFIVDEEEEPEEEEDERESSDEEAKAKKKKRKKRYCICGILLC
jgi:hypothetical protein